MESSDPSSSSPSSPSSPVSQEPESLSNNDKKEGKKPAIPNPRELPESSRISLLVESEIDDFPSVGTFDASPVVLSDILERDQLKDERSKAINWILKTTYRHGFVHDTAYLAVAYMDRFLSRAYSNDHLRMTALVAAACLSIAVDKMETQPFPMDAIENEAFRAVPLFDLMEASVLDKLEHKTDVLTPFSYTRYFMSELFGEGDPSQKLISASQLILNTLEAINLIDFRPSIVAVAAVVAVTQPQLLREQLESTIAILSLWNPKEIEIVFTCYCFMIECLSRLNSSLLPRPNTDAASSSNPNTDAASSSNSNPNTDTASGSNTNPITGAASGSNSNPNNNRASASNSNPNINGASASNSNPITDAVSASYSNPNNDGASAFNSNPNSNGASSTNSNPNTDAASSSNSNPNNDAASSSNSNPITNAASSSNSNPIIDAVFSSNYNPSNDGASASNSNPHINGASASNSNPHNNGASASNSSPNNNGASTSNYNPNNGRASASNSNPHINGASASNSNPHNNGASASNSSPNNNGASTSNSD